MPQQIFKHARIALIVVGAFVAAEQLTIAQTEPPAGGQGGREGGGRQRGNGGNTGGRGGMGGFMGGQGGRGGMGNMGGMGRGMQDIREALEADFMRRDLPIFVRQLSLTEDQSGVLETLYVDYEAQYQPEVESVQMAMSQIGQTMMRSFMSPERQQRMQGMWDGMRKEMEALEAQNGPMDDDTRRQFFRERMQKATEQFANEAQNSGLDAEIKSGIGEMLTKMEAWQTRKSQLRDGFSEGLKAVLDDDQLSQWPAFERFLVREKTLPKGRISGENVNLFLVIDDLRMPPEEFAKVEPHFNDYETRLDGALRARNAYLEESMPRLFKSIQQSDVDGAARIFKRQAELRSAVRDVNDEYRTTMVNALGGGETEWGRALDGAVLKAGWSRIYDDTSTARMFEAALQIDGLEADKVQAIAEMFAQYGTEIRPVNERLKGLARTEEPTRIAEEGERFATAIASGVSGFARGMGGAMGGGEREDPMRKAYDERSAIGDRYEERLKALLTPEQIESLPSG
ncbi:MAG: hypothetical protein ACO3IB_01105, partial [Phycisphaerales bacterium]